MINDLTKILKISTSPIVHYVLRFGGTPFISMEISFQALKFEFDMPIPNRFGHNFMEFYSSSILYFVHTIRKCKNKKMYFLPGRKEMSRTRIARRSFGCP